MSSWLSLLNESSSSSKFKEFSLKGIEVFVDGREQPSFKKARAGMFLGINHIDTAKLGQGDKQTCTSLQVGSPPPNTVESWPGPKHQ